jgi:hypothetical protein
MSEGGGGGGGGTKAHLGKGLRTIQQYVLLGGE